MKIKLSKNFASNSPVDAFDVRQVKGALNRLGYYTPFEQVGMTGIPDSDVFTALRQFQSDQGILVTGAAQPDDETVKTLNSALQKAPDGRYIWRSVEDDKVRNSHAEFNGTVREWSQSPDPAEEFNCRCWAESAGGEAEDLKQVVISPINDAAKKWNTFDFGWHFAYAFGKSVTLSEIGYLEDTINVARNTMFKNLEDQITNKMRQIKSGPITYRTEKSYDFTNVHWVLGQGVLKTVTAGKVLQNGNSLTIEAIISYDYSDEITDPLSIRQFFRGRHRVVDLPNTPLVNLELFFTDLLLGSVYPVTGKWKTKLTGTVKLKEQ